MDALRQGIYDALAADGTLTTALSTYRTYPALVDGFDIPEDMALPLVWFSIISDTNNDTKVERGREIFVDFHCMTDNTTDPAVIADRIRTILHRQTITVSGWTNIITECNGPIPGENTNTMKELIVSVRFVLTT